MRPKPSEHRAPNQARTAPSMLVSFAGAARVFMARLHGLA
jgi:hypothetical protein